MTQPRTSIRVLTLNVCGLPSSLAPLPTRAQRFCATLESSDVDIVLFQEVWFRRSFAVLPSLLPSFPYVAARRGPLGPAGGVVIFSRLPLGRVGYRSFGWRLPTAGSPRFRIKRAVNSRLQGVLLAELREQRCLVVNTHLTANKDGDWSAGNRYHGFQAAQLRRLQATVRAAQARRPGYLTIMAGDFNLASAGALYPDIVAGQTWRDPFAGADPVTFHAAFLPPGAAAHRIDYLLVGGAPDQSPVTETAVLFTEPTIADDGRPLYVSDHVALTARVSLPGQTSRAR